MPPWAITFRSFTLKLTPGVCYLSNHRRRKLQKACYDARLTTVGTIMTFLFLKSCFDGGRLTLMLLPSQDDQLQTTRRQLFDHHQATLVPNFESHEGGFAAIASDSGLDFNTTVLVDEELNEKMERIHYNGSSANEIKASQDPSYISGKTHVSLLLVTAYTFISSQCQSHSRKHLNHKEYIRRSILHKMEYCSLHGIEMLSYGHTMMPGDLVPNQKSRYRLSLLHKLMISRVDKQDWIWWVNSDEVLITNMSTEMPINTQQYTGFNVVFYGNGSRKPMNNTELVESMIRGSFLIRSCAWSLDFLKQLATIGETHQPVYDASESLSIEQNEWQNQIHMEDFTSQFHPIYYAWDAMETMQKAPATDIKWRLMSHFVGCDITYHCNGSNGTSDQQEFCKSATQKALSLYDDDDDELRLHE